MNKYEQLYPKFAELLKEFEKRFFEKTGVKIYLFSGYRSYEEQQELYNKGRTGIAGEKIVTNAKPGSSFHNFGIAADYAFDLKSDTPKVDWSWDDSFPWDTIGTICKELGLEWGGEFSIVDKPHIQMRFGMTLEKAKYLYMANNKLKDVWTYLDKLISACYPSKSEEIKTIIDTVLPQLKDIKKETIIDLILNFIKKYFKK